MIRRYGQTPAEHDATPVDFYEWREARVTTAMSKHDCDPDDRSPTDHVLLGLPAPSRADWLRHVVDQQERLDAAYRDRAFAVAMELAGVTAVAITAIKRRAERVISAIEWQS